MKQLVCEMCGGTDIIKDEGVFKCQTCGTKYSVAEAKKMMIEGTVEVTGTVKIDNTEQLEKYLELSRNAYDSANGQSAFDYASKALEIEPQNYKCWIAKMKSIEYLGTIGSLRLKEVVEAGKNAIVYAPENHKVDVEIQVYEYELKRTIDLLKMAKVKMEEVDAIRETYQTLESISVYAATKKALELDKVKVKPIDNIANEAVSMAKLVPDTALSKSVLLVKLLDECLSQYRMETFALNNRLSVYGAVLADDVKIVHEQMDKGLLDKIEKNKKVAEEFEIKEKIEKRKRENRERTGRIDEYWNKHLTEKVELESEKENLESILRNMKLEVDDIYKERVQKTDELRKVRDAKISEEIECEKQEDLIWELERQKNNCGIFKGREKKELQTRIEQEKIKLEDMKKNAQEIATRHKTMINARINEVQHMKQDVVAEYESKQARLQEILFELTRDRNLQ